MQKITPVTWPELWSDANPAKVNKVAQAMFKMAKIDITALEAAYNN
jgi:hypothetical protein